MAIPLAYSCIKILSIITIITDMMHYLNIHLGKPLHRDIFGIGTAASGAFSAAANITSTAMTNNANIAIADKTNETNIKIHEDDRQFNAEEAEKAREFNAEEAEKARLWTSEEEVMKRRAEAGLNTAISSDSTKASTAQASGGQASAPSSPGLVTPHLEAPNIGEAIAVGVNAVARTAEAKKILADKKLSEARAKGEEIRNSYTAEQCMSEIELNYSQKRLNEANRLVLSATSDKLIKEQDKLLLESYALYHKFNLDEANFQATLDKHALELSNAVKTFNQDAERYLNDWKTHGYSESWRYGDTIKLSRQTGSLKRDSETNGWSVRGQVGNELSSSASAGLGVADVTVNNKFAWQIGGEYSSQDTTQQDISNGVVSDDIQIFQNTDYYKRMVEYRACLKLVKLPDISFSDRQKINNRMTDVKEYLRTSPEAFKFFLRDLRTNTIQFNQSDKQQLFETNGTIN